MTYQSQRDMKMLFSTGATDVPQARPCLVGAEPCLCPDLGGHMGPRRTHIRGTTNAEAGDTPDMAFSGKDGRFHVWRDRPVAPYQGVFIVRCGAFHHRSSYESRRHEALGIGCTYGEVRRGDESPLRRMAHRSALTTHLRGEATEC